MGNVNACFLPPASQEQPQEQSQEQEQPQEQPQEQQSQFVAAKYPAKTIRALVENMGIEPTSPIACMHDIAVAAEGDAVEEVSLLLPGHIPDVKTLADVLVAFGARGDRPKPHLSVDAFLAAQIRWEDLASYLGVAHSYPGELATFEELLDQQHPAYRTFLHRHALRVDGAFRNGGAPKDPYEGLRPLLPLLPRRFANREATTSRFLNGHAFEADDWPDRNLGINATRVQALLDALLGTATWFGKTPRLGGIVVAGGCPSSGCIGRGTFDPRKGDIDVFMCVPTQTSETRCQPEAERRRLSLADGAKQSVIDALVLSCEGRVSVSYKPKTIDIQATHGRGPFETTYKIQIIRVVFASPAEVLWGFDIPACQLAYDGAAFFATDEAIHAISTGELLFDETRKSTTGLRRLAKYARRLDMRIYVPGMSQRLLDATRIFAIELVLRDALAENVDAGTLAALTTLGRREIARYRSRHDAELPPELDVLQPDGQPSRHRLPDHARPPYTAGVLGLAIELVRAELDVPRRSLRDRQHDYGGEDDDGGGREDARRTPVTETYRPPSQLHKWQRAWKLSSDRKIFTGAFNPLRGKTYANHGDLLGRPARLLERALDP